MREPLGATLAALVASIAAACAPRIALKLDNVAAPCILEAHTDMDSAIATNSHDLSADAQDNCNLLTLSRLGTA